MTKERKVLLAILALTVCAGFFQAAMQMQKINNVLYANAFPGADAGVKIKACLTALPSTGGTCDARGLLGNQNINTNIWAGITKPVVLLLGNAKFTDISCWTIANDGAPTPNQAAIHIIGAGIDAAATGSAKVPTSGTVIDMSCFVGPAKINTKGRGVMEIEGISFMDSSGGALPFIQTTNTILKLHDNQFFGSKTGLACDQDAIVFGGTTTTIGGGDNAPFQGYGSTVERNFFDRIRRAFYGRTFVNGLVVRDNTVWVFSGSNLAGGAAIEFDGGPDNNVGNVVRDNLIEVTNYRYGVKFNANGFNNTIAGNNFYDANGYTQAGVDFETNDPYNLVIAGYQQDTYPMYREAGTSVGTNTLIHAHQNQNVIMPQPMVFSGVVTETSPSVNGQTYVSKVLTTNDAFWWGVGTAGQPGFGLWLDPLGVHASAETIVTFKRYDVNQRGVFINAATTGYFECLADCRFRAAAGATGWLGTNASPSDILLTDAGIKVNNGIDGNGSGIKHARISTGSIGASSNVVVTNNWGTSFANTNYTVTCSVVESTGNLAPWSMSAKTASGIGMVVHNNDAGGAHTGTLECIGMHD